MSELDQRGKYHIEGRFAHFMARVSDIMEWEFVRA